MCVSGCILSSDPGVESLTERHRGHRAPTRNKTPAHKQHQRETKPHPTNKRKPTQRCLMLVWADGGASTQPSSLLLDFPRQRDSDAPQQVRVLVRMRTTKCKPSRMDVQVAVQFPPWLQAGLLVLVPLYFFVTRSTESRAELSG
eukprot:2418393-Rhodomonas_salina.2